MFKKISMIGCLFCSTAYCSEISDYSDHPIDPCDIIDANLPVDYIVENYVIPQEKGSTFTLSNNIFDMAEKIKIRAASNPHKPLEFKNNRDTRFDVIAKLCYVSIFLNTRAEEKVRKLTLEKLVNYHFSTDFNWVVTDNFDLKSLYYLFYFLTVDKKGEKITSPYSIGAAGKFFKLMDSLQEELAGSEFEEQIYRAVSQDESLLDFLGTLYQQ